MPHLEGWWSRERACLTAVIQTRERKQHALTHFAGRFRVETHQHAQVRLPTTLPDEANEQMTTHCTNLGAPLMRCFKAVTHR